MRSYPFINGFFKNVLSKSKAIQGRFYVTPRYGIEVNSDQLGEVLTQLPFNPDPKKYPLSLMMPPRSRGNFTDSAGEWESYVIVMFFLKTTFYDSANQTTAPNKDTGTSTHTVLQDWHDMKRAAVNFLRVVDAVQKTTGLIKSAFRLPNEPKIIDPISSIGNDRLSGVRLQFSASLFIGCTLEDYNSEDLSSITIPAEDTHPEHNL